MKIETVDLFYLSLPEVQDIGDGSQDALLARVRAGGQVGWGECESSPLVSLANWCCPMSHSACKPVSASVLGQACDSPDDIFRIVQDVRANGLDIAQTDHTLSGIEIALWDLLGKTRGEPVYKLLGYPRTYPKLPYASALFGADPEATLTLGRQIREQGFRAVKFGWGPFGKGSVEEDRDQVAAAREGVGAETMLLVDAGTVWEEDVERAALRLPLLEEFDVTWLEEPFVGEALEAYRALAARSGTVRLAGGEGAHNFHRARNLIDHGAIGFVQIDTGRIGGIGTAKRVADYAAGRGVPYVNHTFTTHLALCASLQPYAGLEGMSLCEYPVESSPLARELTPERLEVGEDGLIRLPERPGLGIEADPKAIKAYLVDAEITVGGRLLYRTPEI